MKHAELYRPKRARRSARARRQEIEAALAAADRASAALVISHGHCLDGVGSAIMALRHFGTDGAGVVYVQPSEMANVLDLAGALDSRGRRLVIADLSVDRDQYDRVVAACGVLAARGWQIEWRDHHEKQWEGLDLDRIRPHLHALEVNEDATESGASLMQQALCPRDAFARRLAETIRDRDLWWNKTRDSETLEFAITWLGDDEFTKHMLARTGRAPVVDAEIQYAADRQRALIEEHTRVLLDDALYFDTRRGDRVGVVYGWLPKNVGLHRLLRKARVRVAINVRPNGKASLRSRKDAPISHLVARRFSGGGHPNASGADLRLRGLAYEWYVLRHGRVKRTFDIAQAAVEELEGLDAK